MAKKTYDIGYTSGKHEVLNLSDEEVRLLRFNNSDETKIVCSILPAEYHLNKSNGMLRSRRAYAR